MVVAPPVVVVPAIVAAPVIAAAAAVVIPKVEIPKVEIPKVELPVAVPVLSVPVVTVPVIELPVVEIPKVAVPVVVAAVAAVATIHKPEVGKEEVRVVHPEVKKVVPPVYVEPLVEEAKTGFNWWWLLLPLLLLAAWWLWANGCNKPTVAVTPPVPVEAPKVVETPKAAVPIVPPSCDLNWVFFDYDKSEIRSDATASLDHLVSLMKDNAGSTTTLKAFTDAKGTVEYNEALSLRRANSAKAYLTAHGIAADRITTDHLGKSDPIAANTTDDSGRHYNRRIEIYLKDKDGKSMCQSVEPTVPSNLKK